MNTALPRYFIHNNLKKNMNRQDLEKVLAYLKTVTASIVYTDPYDYSAGIEGAEVDCIPETVEELAAVLGVPVPPEPREVILSRPISCLDLESTGTDTENDRICSISVTKIGLDLSLRTEYTLVNPGIPIPPETTAIHGITDEMVKDKPTFKELFPFVKEFIKDTDVLTYNGIRFDIPLFLNECARNGFEWDYSGQAFPDAFKVFSFFNPRNLSAAHKHYLGYEMENAHTADADTQATARVFLEQLRRHTELPLNMNELQLFVNNGKPIADFSGKFHYNEYGEACYSFGKKWKGVPVYEVENEEASLPKEKKYSTWVLSSDFPADSKNFLTTLLNNNNNQ